MAKEWEIITKTNFWGRKSYEIREKENNSGGGCLILLVIIVAVLVFAFTAPYRFIEPHFDVWEFAWVKDIHFWMYCLSAWITLFFTIVMLKALWTFSKLEANAFKETFDSPLITLGLFAGGSSMFTAYLAKALVPDAFILAAAGVLIGLGLLYFMLTAKAETDTRASVLVLSAFCVLGPYLWIGSSSVPRYYGKPETEETIPVQKMIITAHTVANIRSLPSTDSEILHRAQRGAQITALLDSTYSGNSLWYKVQVDGVEGWVSGGLVGRE